MAELNRVEVMKKIFAQAQKLMIAQQAAILAKAEEEEATAELIRLNGSATINLSDETRHFFECEGNMETRLKYGHDVSPEETKCAAIVPVASYYIDRQTKRPEQTPLCEDCKNAEYLRKADLKAATGENPAPAPKTTAEIPF